MAGCRSMVRCTCLGVIMAISGWLGPVAAQTESPSKSTTVRVFIFAGQSNMVGSDSKVKDIDRFPPFRGLEKPQPEVRFSYDIGRESQHRSEGWVDLQPVNNTVGPELSFARRVARRSEGPIAIIKCAAGGTHLGGDWNPEQPSGFEMYPRALSLVKKSLADLDTAGVSYRLEGFVWHQGENDMFDEDYLANYGANLQKYLARWRKDLETPKLRFYLGELCTKTIWGMDLRPRMAAIARGQRLVADADPLAEYVPTSHVGVEIGGGVGLHYHYGTLGQLEHGVNYADAYLRSIGKVQPPRPSLDPWPYQPGTTPPHTKLKLFVVAGHRNMEGERAFVQELGAIDGGPALRKDNREIPFKYDIGASYRRSNGWEALGPAGPYDTFGPELSFAHRLKQRSIGPFAIAKFTDSGSQIIDWTPEGGGVKPRHVYPRFVAFVREAVRELTERGHEVELAGIIYHVGENDMSFFPYRRDAATRVAGLIEGVRRGLAQPNLRWIVSQQPPTNHKDVNKVDVTQALQAIADADPRVTHVKAFDLPKQPQQLVITTAGVVWLGERLADAWLDTTDSD